MFDPHTQRLDDQVKRAFGPTAAIAGSVGTINRPGDVRILVGGRLVGTGRTFAESLRMAQRLGSAESHK